MVIVFIQANVLYASPVFELKTSTGNLVVENNVLKINSVDVHKTFGLTTELSKIWTLNIKDKSLNKILKVIPSINPNIEKKTNTIEIKYNKLKVRDELISIDIVLTISIIDDAFVFKGRILNSTSDIELIKLDFPRINSFKVNNPDLNIYWPSGLGRSYSSGEEFGSKTLNYPSREGAMPWFTLTSNGVGAYIGVHNPDRSMADYTLEYHQENDVFNTYFSTPLFQDEIVTPDFIYKIYSGDWHVAAKYYRQWYDKHFKIVNKPNWVNDDTGWLLAILKQQNGNVMWPYNKLGLLSDIAKEFGITTLGLYGWAHGGHDRYYPNYYPDNLMGGKTELKKGIQVAQQKGLKVILYANGRLMDTSTEFYQYQGNETMMMNDNLKPILETWRKHLNSTPVVFAKGCPGSSLWRKTMLNLAYQAVELGADGIIFDQVGSFPHLCYSEYHDHALPQEAFTKFRNQMLAEIRTKIHEIDEDFVIMVESINDAILQEVDYYHGVGAGFYIANMGFPELLRYTFPELTITQRNRNPMIPRDEANFALVYGLKHEIECRYTADVEYLVNDVYPTDSSYANIISKPSPQKIGEVTPEKARSYMQRLVKFEEDNAKFLKYGLFIDQDGFSVKGNVVAKGFENGNQIGVVLWNRNMVDESYSISFPGYSLIENLSPDNQKENSSILSANSVRLLIFQKN